MLFRTKHERHATSAIDLAADQRSQIGELHHSLFRLAVGERPSARYEGALLHSFGQRLGFSCLGKKLGSAHGRARLAPVRRVGSHNSQARKSEVRHPRGPWLVTTMVGMWPPPKFDVASGVTAQQPSRVLPEPSSKVTTMAMFSPARQARVA